MKIQVGDDNSNKFTFSISQYFGELIFLVSKDIQCMSDFFLIFKSQRIRIIKISGNGSF